MGSFQLVCSLCPSVQVRCPHHYPFCFYLSCTLTSGSPSAYSLTSTLRAPHWSAGAEGPNHSSMFSNASCPELAVTGHAGKQAPPLAARPLGGPGVGPWPSVCPASFPPGTCSALFNPGSWWGRPSVMCPRVPASEWPRRHHGMVVMLFVRRALTSQEYVPKHLRME